MGAPTTIARQTPGGIKLDDGYQALIAFSLDPDVSLFEKSVQPPGYDGGEAIMTSTMWNETFHTKAPRSLVDVTDLTVEFAYDAEINQSQILALVNKKGSVSVHYPNGGILNVFAYLRTVEFSPLVEGEQPSGTATITVTNVDPSDGSEAGPEYIPPTGTGT